MSNANERKNVVTIPTHEMSKRYAHILHLHILHKKMELAPAAADRFHKRQ